ncbi:uncharacterized protein [Henckelia pumila]|uniref:uncharacterized protein n=1 Tax=Henckelia pumila TaxID=405737 RepID=UPI003C6E56AB
MLAHLSAHDDDMWFVVTYGLMKIMKTNTPTAITAGAPHMIEKPRVEWTSKDRKKASLDNVSRDILYKTLDKNMFSKIKICTTAKEIGEKLTQLCEENDQTKENKLMVAIQKFDNIKMKPREIMNEFDERFNSIMIELNVLGKSYSNREVALKVMRALPCEWDVKTVAMRESKDLNKIKLHDLFADLKAYEFELGVRTEEGTSTSQVTKALTAADKTPTTKSAKQLSSFAISLFVKKFGRFMRKNHKNFQSTNRSNFRRKKPVNDNQACYNCGKEGHFISDCTKPKKDEKITSHKKISREERKNSEERRNKRHY